MGKTPETVRYLGAGQGRKREGETNKKQRQRQACGAGRRDKKQRLVGAEVDDVHVEIVPLRQRRWGAGETEGCYVKNWILIGGDRI